MIRIKNPTPARLPSEYQELDYIQSTGTQWIDTGYTPVQNDELEIKNVICKPLTSTHQALFSAGTGTYQWILLISQKSDNAVLSGYYKYFSSGNADEISITHNLNTAKTVKSNSTGLYYGDTNVGSLSYGGAVNTTLRLLIRANGATPATAQIGEVTIKNGDTLKRNMIPCYRKSDNAVGMYDLVEKKFFGNAGTGTFLMGNEVHKRDINIDPAIFNIPAKRGYINGNLFYGEEPPKYEQLVNYTMLYDRGDECTDVTGGWDKYFTNFNSFWTVTGALTKNSDNIQFLDEVALGYHTYKVLFTNSAININGFVGALIVSELVRKTAGKTTGVFNVEFELKTTPTDAGATYKRLSYTLYDKSSGIGKNVNAINFSDYITDYSTTELYAGFIANTQDYICNAKAYALAFFKEDDWQTLASIAGITANSINDILTNSSTLLSNEEAVNYMTYNCTGSFMASAVASETFLTALNSSAYNTTIQANEHWNKFLSMVA